MKTIYDFEVEKLGGEKISLETYKGKTILIVNTASKCGLTPQYEGLEKLYKKYKDKGFVILGFPCNQFGNQEPGGAKEISENCLINYGVSFPMFAKMEVNGENAHPLFVFLRESLPGIFGNKIKWNFTKFLIDENGKPIKRFGPTFKPEKIEKYLKKLFK
ncbi:glutathione peroxidase [Candidatus Gracilibacteria bacterium]|nr:glutathione peroxidase [Candidatus Gracilibacteria bacterium]